MDGLLALLVAAINTELPFRYVLQPVLALLLGLRDARLDARAGKPPYLFSLFEGKALRRLRIGEAVRAIAIPFGVAVALAGVAQLLAGGRVVVWRVAVVGVLLIGLPYVLARGLGNRAITSRKRRHPA